MNPLRPVGVLAAAALALLSVSPPATAAAPAYTLNPSSGPIGTIVTVRGTGCPDTNAWADGHDGAFAFFNNKDGHENFSGAYQVPFDVAPDASFALAFVVPRTGRGLNNTVLDPLPPGIYNTMVACGGTNTDFVPFTVTNGSAPLVERWAGSDRYATSAVISAKAFSPGVSVAYVASGADFPDALSGAAVAGMNRAPVLLSAPTVLPSVIATELGRLKPKRIVVLGGTGAVSEAVKSKLADYTTGAVDRWAGKDRYGTSATISSKSFTPGVPVAYVASGAGFADALAGAPVAGTSRGPVLLAAPTALPGPVAAELGRLKPHRIVVLGGAGAVSNSVKSSLAGYTTGAVERWAGKDRYATSAVIAAKRFGPGVSVAFVASGSGFADALSSAPVAGASPGPVLLTTTSALPAVVGTELGQLAPRKVVVVGGLGAVGSGVAQELAGYVR